MGRTPIAIIHVSDLHFGSRQSRVYAQRATTLARRIAYDAACATSLFIVCSGDVADSGKETEYEEAIGFFDQMMAELSANMTSLAAPPSLVAIPGNHDCDLGGPQSDIRALMIKQGASAAVSFEAGGDISRSCTSVQRRFFSFEARYGGVDGELEDERRLFWQRPFTVGQGAILFNCYNSAWLSRMNERSGDLYFPLQAARAAVGQSETSEALIISVIHHPIGWFEANNARALREHLRQTCDIVMTGHEHERGGYYIKHHEGDALEYVEAPAFREGLSLLLFDPHSGEWQVHKYSWTADRIEGHIQIPWKSMPSSARRIDASFRNLPEFRSELETLETEFTHPAGRELSLRDVFVYPDLRRRQLSGTHPSSFSSDRLASHIKGTQRLLIVGGDYSGKTSLAKVLYRDLQVQLSAVPVLLRGRQLRTRTHNIFAKQVQQAFVEQYGNGREDSFKAMPRERRALIIDDFHLVRLDPESLDAALREMYACFGTIVLLAHDLLVDNILTPSGRVSGSQITQYEQLEIRPFGHVARSKLIRKWVAIGEASRGGSLQDLAIALEQDIDNIMRESSLPASPLTVLGVVQIWRTQPPTGIAGSYGHLFSALISAQLNRGPMTVTEHSELFGFLSYVAHAMFSRSVESLTETELEEVSAEYLNDHALKLNLREKLRHLTEVRLLSCNDGLYSFRHRYLFCFFVARYIHDHIGSPRFSQRLRAEVNAIVDGIGDADTSDILLFYLYLSPDLDAIGRVISNSSRIFGEHIEADFKSDVQFVTDAEPQPIELAAPEGDVEERRQERRAALDRMDEAASDTRSGPVGPYSDSLDDSSKLDHVVRSLRIIGQILRSFPGTLERITKRDLADAAYGVALRATRGMLLRMGAVAPVLRQTLKDTLAAKGRDDERAAAQADRFIMWIVALFGYGCLKMLAESVGVSGMHATLQDVLTTNRSEARRMADLAVELEFSEVVSASKVERLWDDVAGDLIRQQILRLAIYDRLYMREPSEPTRQKLAAAVGLKSAPRRVVPV